MPGKCRVVNVDHFVNEFKVVIRSNSNIGPQRLKDLIQTKFEIIKCERTNEEVFGEEVRPSS